MTDHSTAPASPPADARKDTWTLANAKAHLSEVVDRAQTGPQIITRYGRPDAVIVSAEEWARKTARNTLAEFLLASPLRGAELKLRARRTTRRDAVNLLLDTNVPSEVQWPAPSPKVLAWLDTVDEDRAFISVASIAELRRGIALLDDVRRREALTAWLAHDLPARFGGRILPIDHTVAERWGDLMAHSRRSGIALSVMDGFFAATALANTLTLVTRNVKEFAAFGIPLLKPWDGP